MVFMLTANPSDGVVDCVSDGSVVDDFVIDKVIISIGIVSICISKKKKSILFLFRIF